MIIDPDFPDHWKTQLLVELSGDEIAVRCLLRLWSFCQTRKRWVFTEMTPAKLKSICKWPHDTEQWWNAMLECGWVKFNGDKELTVHEWEKYNHRLIHNWNVGKLGGRPSKPKGLPKGSDSKASENPRVIPRGNRLDRIRLDKNKSTPLVPPLRGKTRASKRKIFKKPTLEETGQFANRIKMPLTVARNAWDYYESNGWKVGKNPMKDWNAAFRRWFNTWKEEHPEWKPTETVFADTLDIPDDFVQAHYKMNYPAKVNEWRDWQKFDYMIDELTKAWNASSRNTA